MCFPANEDSLGNLIYFVNTNFTKETQLILSNSCFILYNSWTTYTLNRKTLTSFVMTKPRGSVVITKPLALRMSLCADKSVLVLGP